MRAVEPKLNREGYIRLVQARHPLIPSNRVVPVDTRLDKDISAMVITGPNTGGKTVLLKTIGLLTAMALAGLEVPAEPGSELPLVDGVWADIGDEQSIEQSLSTFSSHMTNIVQLLSQVGPGSLVLLDELGAGTDPTEGAALAMAILKHLQQQGCRVVATTHYSELKAFAYNTPGFINASMEFDVATLSPTYRLLMGTPGKSNAFEISRRLGLPENIIQEAAGSLSSEDVAVAAMLANLEDMRRQVEKEKDKIQVLRSSAAVREQVLMKKEQELQAREAEVLRQAHQEAQRILDDTLSQSRALYDEQQRQIAEKKSAERVWQEAQKKLKDWKTQLEEETPAPVYSGEAPTKVEIGDYVTLPKLNQQGTVLSLPDSDNQVLVQIGVLKMKTPLADLRPANAPQKNKKSRHYASNDLTMSKSSRVESSLSLRGLETAEALPILDKYIDDAFLAGLRQVQINHGRGTGALRRFVHEYLRNHRLVKHYRDGAYNEGGQGVTLVELEQ